MIRGPRVVVAVLSGIGNAVAHLGEATFYHQVYNQLHFMEALKVGQLWLVACFHQGFKARFNQFAEAAAKHYLLTEQVGFGFFPKGGFEDAAPSAANALGIGHGQVAGLAGSILINSEQAGNALTFGVGAAH